MSIKLRKRIKIGPLIINATQNGLTSWGIKVGPFSWNSRTRRKRVDLPGPFYWTGRKR